MDREVVSAFNTELTSIYEIRPPISKNKIVDITKAAMKAIKYYKHVVFSVERFLGKCKAEYKIPCLYVIDSILRQSKRQFKEKDVFGPRFAKNFENTLNALLQCPPADRPKIARTLNLWEANGVYPLERINEYKKICKESGLETDLEKVERMVKGEKADLTIYAHGSQPPPPAGSSSHRHHQKQKERENEKDENGAGTSSSAAANAAAAAAAVAALAGAPLLAPPTSLAPPTWAANEQPSDVAPEGTISERMLQALIQKAGLDYAGAFTNDITLLRSAHALITDRLRQQVEKDKEASKGQGNIKDLLSTGFDYSDDDEEDDGEEGGRRDKEKAAISQTSVASVAPPTTEQLEAMVAFLLRDNSVQQALGEARRERITKLTQAAQLAAQQTAQDQIKAHVLQQQAKAQATAQAIQAVVAAQAQSQAQQLQAVQRQQQELQAAQQQIPVVTSSAAGLPPGMFAAAAAAKLFQGMPPLSQAPPSMPDTSGPPPGMAGHAGALQNAIQAAAAAAAAAGGLQGQLPPGFNPLALLNHAALLGGAASMAPGAGGAGGHPHQLPPNLLAFRLAAAAQGMPQGLPQGMPQGMPQGLTQATSLMSTPPPRVQQQQQQPPGVLPPGATMPPPTHSMVPPPQGVPPPFSPSRPPPLLGINTPMGMQQRFLQQPLDEEASKQRFDGETITIPQGIESLVPPQGGFFQQRLDSDERDRERGEGREHERERGDRKERRRSRDRGDRYSSREDRKSSSRRHRSRSRDADDGGGRRKRREERERERDRERRKMGLPTDTKHGFTMFASCTVWLGRLPSNVSEEDLKMAMPELNEAKKIQMIASRACAYVTLRDRKTAFRFIEKNKRVDVRRKEIKLSWATGQGVKACESLAGVQWDAERGVSLVAHEELLQMDAALLGDICDGSWLDVDSLPAHLRGSVNEKGEPTSGRGGGGSDDEGERSGGAYSSISTRVSGSGGGEHHRFNSGDIPLPSAAAPVHAMQQQHDIDISKVALPPQPMHMPPQQQQPPFHPFAQQHQMGTGGFMMAGHHPPPPSTGAFSMAGMMPPPPAGSGVPHHQGGQGGPFGAPPGGGPPQQGQGGAPFGAPPPPHFMRGGGMFGGGGMRGATGFAGGGPSIRGRGGWRGGGRGGGWGGGGPGGPPMHHGGGGPLPMHHHGGPPPFGISLPGMPGGKDFGASEQNRRSSRWSARDDGTMNDDSVVTSTTMNDEQECADQKHADVLLLQQQAAAMKEMEEEKNQQKSQEESMGEEGMDIEA